MSTWVKIQSKASHDEGGVQCRSADLVVLQVLRDQKGTAVERLIENQTEGQESSPPPTDRFLSIMAQ